jgi:hypothetical protein
MKKETEKSNIVAFNTRVPKPIKLSAGLVARALGWTIQDLTELALANLLGASDEETQKRIKTAREIAKSLRMPFLEPACRQSGLVIQA